MGAISLPSIALYSAITAVWCMPECPAGLYSLHPHIVSTTHSNDATPNVRIIQLVMLELRYFSSVLNTRFAPFCAHHSSITTHTQAHIHSASLSKSSLKRVNTRFHHVFTFQHLLCTAHPRQCWSAKARPQAFRSLQSAFTPSYARVRAHAHPRCPRQHPRDR